MKQTFNVRSDTSEFILSIAAKQLKSVAFELITSRKNLNKHLNKKEFKSDSQGNEK